MLMCLSKDVHLTVPGPVPVNDLSPKVGSHCQSATASDLDCVAPSLVDFRGALACQEVVGCCVVLKVSPLTTDQIWLI